MAPKLASVVMAALMGLSPAIKALGLGDLDSDSGLNEPLLARIPLLSLRDTDTASIRVSLASPAAFKRAGLDRPFYLSQLKFEVKQTGGENYILVSTNKPIKEPFLDFLLDVRWPQGELQREYTMLLDPPQYSAGKSADSIASNHVNASINTSWTRSQSSLPMQTTAAGEGRTSARDGSTVTRYGPVQANQTLWVIATEVRPHSGATIYQTMQAILQNNPQAFIDGNINALMQGAILRVPPREAIARIDVDQAALQMQTQLVRWQKQHARSEISPADTDAVTPATATPSAKGRLQVVGTHESAAAGATASLTDQALAPTQQNILRLQQQLAAVKQRNASLQTANAQLQQQASSLGKKLGDLKGLVKLQLNEHIQRPIVAPTADSASAANMVLQSTAIEPRNAAAVANASGALAAAPDMAADRSAKQAKTGNAATTAATPQSGPIMVANSVAKLGAAGQLSGPRGSQLTQPSVAAADLPARLSVQQQASPSLTARLLAYLPQDFKRLMLFASGLLLTVLLLLWVRRRRRDDADLPHEFSPQALAPTAGQAFATTAKLDNATLSHADTHLQTATVVPDEALLAEAEAYVAYGRYDQAQELLDRALGEHPESQELRLKLLEVLAAQDDRNGFEAEAQVLHTQVADETDPGWQRVLELGQRIAPDHPLFSKAAPPETATPVVQVQPEQAVNTVAVAAAELTSAPAAQDMEAEIDRGTGKLTLDPSAGLNKTDSALADGREKSAVLEFDLGEIEAFVSQQAQENIASVASRDSAAEDDWSSLDFSLPDDQAVPVADGEDNGADNDLDTLHAGGSALHSDEPDAEGTNTAELDDLVSLDEAGTKLDLARAYLDMGDALGAKSLLNEVVTEGNPAQQSEAQDLLRRAG